MQTANTRQISTPTSSPSQKQRPRQKKKNTHTHTKKTPPVNTAKRPQSKSCTAPVAFETRTGKHAALNIASLHVCMHCIAVLYIAARWITTYGTVISQTTEYNIIV